MLMSKTKHQEYFENLTVVFVPKQVPKNIFEMLKAKINQEMEPYKKQNKQLMSIIGAAEKGHNLLLNTMQNINSEIAGNF